MSRRTETVPADYFAGIYASDPDPWRFTSSAYERDKYAATLAALPRARYRSAFEPACSIGVFTRALAERCDRLLAVDLVPAAVEAARARCADRPNVEIRQGAMPADWPEGRFDLMVLSEFLYFLGPSDLTALVRRAGEAIEPGGDLILVHWLGVTDYPQSGDAAAEGFITQAAPFAGLLHQSRTAAYRLDVLRAGSPA
ncbi:MULTISPECIES: class I SAM-dependent DNA methyltransferase [unclassified Methylobacterium]|jgi:SAM-dependent methyltransferase|uniref:class I SAM-dependent DNA methyltransferase n=1 Tax=unclassified Methylobacterium TaxID=2615210 RepID=UPI001355755F|nr:SAM-dependent methyltransferase [Methylobacterium sp. 2A]MWV20923.1 methyltransferase domain-containing protein [Methylobacterium sp. 2A]